jgi:predicted O-linked N-acetylglucosamine transferase (SPINDLY family)
LPDDKFVFCCLNGLQKLTPETFNAWMTILGQADGSVLWLLGATDDTNGRIRKLAAERGVSPDRLVFAAKRPNPDHLARYPLADLFLDTFPYGAHTTAADAMWMGVPLLTVAGRSFASRVCASLVRAAGMEELICPTTAVYISRAVAFAGNEGLLAAAKQKLAANRDSCLLFDTPQLTRYLEDLFRQMWKDLETGSLPAPDLTNLDVYCDIGAELNLEDVGSLTDDAYLGRYRAKLGHRHLTYPIRPDRRLWTGTN